ncbi:MAG: hypothetical protein H6819_11435, partial [Phycisphaerales bacterium]|nr:hypothetical protein [Phycisphaerales bacterium]
PLVGQDNVLIVWQGEDFDCASGNFNNLNTAIYEVDCQECNSAIETCPDDDAPEVSTFFASAGTTYWFQCGQEGAFPDAGGLSEFSITCSTVTGGCCVGGICTEQFPTQCEANGGLYAGDGTDCSGGCPGGACCETAGTCATYATQTACETAGGVWQGDGVDCINVNCGGACCVPGSCIDAGSESLCLNMGGTYAGNGTTCATTVCNDDCADAIAISGGITYVGTNVGSTGEDADTSCVSGDVNAVWYSWVAECTDSVAVSLCGSSFDTTLGVYDACGGLEIACNDDNAGPCGGGPGTISNLNFDAIQGTTYWIRVSGWNGAQGVFNLSVTCPPFGACCIMGSCSDLSINDCNTAGGTFLGGGTDCVTNGMTCTVGGCCLLDGTCSDGVTEANCLTMNGQYLGGATECSTSTCSPVGACCTSGVCEVSFQNDCAAGGGSFLGEGTACDANACMGACCFENACTIEDQANCEGAGQIFWGPGSTCDNIICPGPGFVQLNNNWNGIAHPSEQGDPDRLPGYRTIGDRGLVLDTATSVGGGTYSVLSGNLQFSFETRPDVVDMIMIGRRSVNPNPWDDVNDGLADNIGIAPTWDPTGGTGTVTTNTTTLNPVVVVGDDFEIGVLSHGTEGGGRFNMTLTFTDLTTITTQVHAPDWFANGNATPDAPGGALATQALLTPAPLSGGDGFDAVAAHDRAEAGAPLNLTKSTMTRASILAATGTDVSGKSLQSITFDAWIGSTFSAGGIYAVSMAVPGACCLPDGNCSEGVRSDCINAGGIYQGDGTECAVVGADCAIGACCFTNGTCADDYQASTCVSEGGFYLGSGTMCATSSCPPTGACCNQSTFECTIDFGSACTNAGNFYSGDGSDCTFGCDCNNNSTLDLFELLPSTDCNDNGTLDECETPNPSTVGACCIDEVCSLETDGDCATAGGIFFGYCTDCSQIICPGEGYVDLDFNWNGVVHPGESNMPDALEGYRSISDRGLIFGSANSVGGVNGILTSGNLTYYMRQLGGPSLDIIHIGGRGNAWDLTVDGDNVGVRPNWDPSTGTGQNTPTSVSTFPPTPVLNSSFELGVLYNAGNGGGNFRMTLGFTDASTVSVTLNAPDWFANNNGSPSAPQTGVATQAKLPGPLSSGDGFAAASDNDRGNPDQPLNCIQAVVTAASLQSGLGFDVTGRQLNSITFDTFQGGGGAGNAVFAVSYYNPTTGACTCPGDANLDNQLDGSDVQSFVDCLLGGMGDCSCADVDGMNGTDMGDIAGFVSNLLAGPACP